MALSLRKDFPQTVDASNQISKPGLIALKKKKEKETGNTWNYRTTSSQALAKGLTSSAQALDLKALHSSLLLNKPTDQKTKEEDLDSFSTSDRLRPSACHCTKPAVTARVVTFLAPASNGHLKRRTRSERASERWRLKPKTPSGKAVKSLLFLLATPPKLLGGFWSPVSPPCVHAHIGCFSSMLGLQESPL